MYQPGKDCALTSELLTWSKSNLSQSGVGIGIGIAIDVVFDSDADTDPEKKRIYFGAHPCPEKGANSLEFLGYVRRSELIVV